MQKLLVPLYHNQLQGRGSKVIKKKISLLCKFATSECHRFKFADGKKYFLLEVARSLRNVHGLRSKRTSILPLKIRTLFTTIKMWKQPKSPSMGGWINNCVYTANGGLFSLKMEEIDTCYLMDEPGGCYTK